MAGEETWLGRNGPAHGRFGSFVRPGLVAYPLSQPAGADHRGVRFIVVEPCEIEGAGEGVFDVPAYTFRRTHASVLRASDGRRLTREVAGTGMRIDAPAARAVQGPDEVGRLAPSFRERPVSLVVDFELDEDFHGFRASGMMLRLVAFLFVKGPLSCATCPDPGTSDKRLRQNET